MKICTPIKTLVFALVFAVAGFPVQAQKLDKSVVQEMIENADFVFVAQMALPMGGGSRYLTSSYDMKVSDGTINTYLPYFGRAYRAPANLTGGGIDFESTDYEYTVEDRKRGGWEIRITPRDVEDVRQLYLTVSENGTASLRVNSERRQSISFNGYLEEMEARPE